MLSVQGFLRFVGLTLTVAACATDPAVDAESSTSFASSSLVTTDSGTVRGKAQSGVLTFRGIPFAAPPTGALRWRDPQPVARWTDVRDATEYGQKCVQKD